MLEILAERSFPAREVVALASRRSVGKQVSFGDDEVLDVKALEDTIFPIPILHYFHPARQSRKTMPRAPQHKAV
jgi:aspartate-semialdehyde dehydrogenase